MSRYWSGHFFLPSSFTSLLKEVGHILYNKAPLCGPLWLSTFGVMFIYLEVMTGHLEHLSVGGLRLQALDRWFSTSRGQVLSCGKRWNSHENLYFRGNKSLFEKKLTISPTLQLMHCGGNCTFWVPSTSNHSLVRRCRGAGTCASCHWVRGRVHPGKFPSKLQGMTQPFTFTPTANYWFSNPQPFCWIADKNQL